MVKKIDSLTHQFMVRVTEETSKQIVEYAAKNEISKAAMVRKAIKDFFKRQMISE